MSTQTRNKSKRIIRASEIGQYAFCAQAWWLGTIVGVDPENIEDLTAGTLTHQQHGRQVGVSIALSRVGYAVLIFAIIIGLIILLTH